MKFSTTAVNVMALLATSASSTTSAFAPTTSTSSSRAFGVARATISSTTSSALFSTTEENVNTETEMVADKKNKKEERLRMMKSPNFYRRGFKEVRDKVEDLMGEQFKSELVEDMKGADYIIEKDGVKVYLAKVCYIRYSCYCVV